MHFFSKIFELNKYKNHRSQQFKDETEVHNKLYNIKNKCPEVIVSLLLWRSHINREQFKIISDSTILELPSLIDEHMHWIDNFHKNILESSESPNFCNELLNIMIQ